MGVVTVIGSLRSWWRLGRPRATETCRTRWRRIGAGLDPARWSVSSRAAPPGSSVREDVADLLERAPRARAAGRSIRASSSWLAPVAAVARLRIDLGRAQQVELVVVAQRADAQPDEPGEASDGQQVRVQVLHDSIVDPRATGESSPVVQARSSSRSIARRMKRAASALLPPSFCALVLLERPHEVAEEQVQRRRPLQVAGRERRLQPGDRGPGVVDGVALGDDQLADVGPGRVGGRPQCWSSQPPDASGAAGASGRSSLRPEPSAVGFQERRRRAAPALRLGSRRPRSRWRAPVGLEHAHRQLVPPATVAEDRLARPALDDEAAALVGPDRALVELEHEQRDAVQARASRTRGRASAGSPRCRSPGPTRPSRRS